MVLVDKAEVRKAVKKARQIEKKKDIYGLEKLEKENEEFIEEAEELPKLLKLPLKKKK